MKRLLFILLFFALPAQANPIVADISTYRVAIDAGFTGIRLFIFGARNAAGDVVVVIRGPERNFIVRKKESIGGVWMNRRQVTLQGVPDYYAVASAKPVEAINAPTLMRLLGIGSKLLLPAPQGAHEKALFPEFADAFLDYQQKNRLYNEALPLSFMGETLFKTTIPFPDNIPRGDYTAEIYLISDGQLAGMQAMPIRVEKSGFDATVSDFAHHYPWLYGLTAVLLALGAGWGAGKLFERA